MMADTGVAASVLFSGAVNVGSRLDVGHEMLLGAPAVRRKAE
jgi:hypothetical protein